MISIHRLSTCATNVFTTRTRSLLSNSCAYFFCITFYSEVIIKNHTVLDSIHRWTTYENNVFTTRSRALSSNVHGNFFYLTFYSEVIINNLDINRPVDLPLVRTLSLPLDHELFRRKSVIISFNSLFTRRS